jgi:hypothetical protein
MNQDDGFGGMRDIVNGIIIVDLYFISLFPIIIEVLKLWWLP